MNNQPALPGRRHPLLFPAPRLALALLLPLLGGCVKDDPAFRVSDLTSEPKLVGRWESTTNDKPHLTLTFSEDRQSVENDRLKARPVKVTLENAKGEDTAVVYAMKIESTEVDDAGIATTRTIAARAYAVKAGDRTLLCVQNDDAEPEGLVPTFTISKQLFIGVSVNGDSLAVNWPKVQITLAPSVKLLDPPASDDAAAPTVDTAITPDAKGTVPGTTLLTNSPDRALWVYRTYGSRPGFWEDQGLMFQRVRTP